MSPMTRIVPVLLVSGLLAASSSAQGPLLNPVTVADVPAESVSYFNLRTNTLIDAAQKTVSNWDIAFRSTSIVVNGEARYVDTAFDVLTSAPEDGYKEDADETGAALAGGSGSGWYYYDMDAHVLTPLPDRTIVLRTRDGKVAKVEIISYYRGGDTGFGEPRFYTFRYALQPDGSGNLASETCSEDEMECKIDG